MSRKFSIPITHDAHQIHTNPINQVRTFLVEFKCQVVVKPFSGVILELFWLLWDSGQSWSISVRGAVSHLQICHQHTLARPCQGKAEVAEFRRQWQTEGGSQAGEAHNEIVLIATLFYLVTYSCLIWDSYTKGSSHFFDKRGFPVGFEV